MAVSKDALPAPLPSSLLLPLPPNATAELPPHSPFAPTSGVDNSRVADENTNQTGAPDTPQEDIDLGLLAETLEDEDADSFSSVFFCSLLFAPKGL
jgi:hypothetical protein